MRAAARRVDDECLEVRVAINLHVGGAYPLSPLEVAVVREQGATASLGARKPHFAARELEQLDRGLVRLRVENRHEKSDQERNAVLALADRRRYAAAWWLEAGAQAGQLPPRAHDRSQSDGLGCFCRRADRAQTARLGDQLPQCGAGEPAVWLRSSTS